MYMMGRGPHPPRGTIDVPRWKRKFGLHMAMGVNNVGNAFTPQGTADPMGLLPFGVAIYQAANEEDCMSLLESITIDSRRAVDTVTKGELRLLVGDRADLLVLHGTDQSDVTQVVLTPGMNRTVIKGGKVIAKRRLIIQSL